MPEDVWTDILRRIYYETPATISIVEGEWKTGKTDFSIHLAVDELKNRLGFVKRVSANIQQYEDADCTIPTQKDIEYIDNFDQLKAFIKQPSRKVFIYDEALKHSPSKKAMTALNAEWFQVIPELSKGGSPREHGGCHLFVLTQEGSLTEKLFMNPAFKAVTWKKLTLSPRNPQYRKMVMVSSKLLKRKITFRNLPPTSIYFNPFQGANWSMHPTEISLGFLPEDVKIANAYASGMSTDELQKQFPQLTSRMEATRAIRKGIKYYLSMSQVTQEMRRDNSAVSP